MSIYELTNDELRRLASDAVKAQGVMEEAAAGRKSTREAVDAFYAAVAVFERAATPQAILALLDERDALARRVGELERAAEPHCEQDHRQRGDGT